MKLRSQFIISALIFSVVVVALLFYFWPGEEKLNQQHITSLCCVGGATFIFLGGLSIQFRSRYKNKILKTLSITFLIITIVGVLLLATYTEVVALIIMYASLFTVIFLLLINDLNLMTTKRFKVRKV